MTGTSATTVDPLGNATREQVATIICRMLKLDTTGYNSVRKFSDDLSISSWARPYVYTMRKYGYMNGSGNNMVNPRSNITRAEVVQLLSNITGTYVPKKDKTDSGDTFKSTFSSNFTASRAITLINSVVGNDVIMTENSKNITVENTTIKNRLFVMGKATISLKSSTIGEIYLASGKSTITGIDDNVSMVYVSEDASESTINTYPKQLVLAPGARVKIGSETYENESNIDKVYYGIEVKNDIAAEQNSVSGGPKISGVKFTQSVNNNIHVSNIKLSKGESDIAEVGVIAVNEVQGQDTVQPSISNYTKIVKYSGKDFSSTLEFDVGELTGYRTCLQ